MRLRVKLALWGTILLGVFVWGRFGHNKPSGLSALPSSDKERITVNPLNHTLSIQTQDGKTQTLFLPDRSSTVEVTKSGTLKITDRQLGFERDPFFGGMYSLKHGDFVAGVDLFYFRKLDLGLALGLPYPSAFSSTSVMAVVSYNVWSNARISIGLDQHKDPYVGLTVRL